MTDRCRGRLGGKGRAVGDDATFDWLHLRPRGVAPASPRGIGRLPRRRGRPASEGGRPFSPRRRPLSVPGTRRVSVAGRRRGQGAGEAADSTVPCFRRPPPRLLERLPSRILRRPRVGAPTRRSLAEESLTGRDAVPGLGVRQARRKARRRRPGPRDRPGVRRRLARLPPPWGFLCSCISVRCLLDSGGTLLYLTAPNLSRAASAPSNSFRKSLAATGSAFGTFSGATWRWPQGAT